VAVYGAAKPATGVASALDGPHAASAPTGYDSEHHRITALVPDDGNGLELRLTY
jgi:hypothetical protein